MAHDLEMHDGKVAFALRGEPAWHKLAERVFTEDEHVTTAEMLSAASLAGWNVRLEDVILPDGGTDVLSVVGERYRTYQNEELFAFGDNLIDGGGAWESAGSIRNGRTVFGSLALGRDILIDGQGIADRVKTYLLVTTSHDGSSAVQAMTTPVRVVCQNTLNMALGAGTKQSFKVRHTQTVGDRVAQARAALGISFAYADAFEAEANALFAASITDAQFDALVKSLYPEPDRSDAAKAAITKYDTKVDLIWDIYRNGFGTSEGVTGTAWGAMNALTERIDWHRNGRKGTDAGTLAAASGFDAQVNAEKQRIRKAVLAVAGL